MLPVDGAGVRSEQDRVGHDVEVQYLGGAVVPPVVPGRVVVEGGGEERRVVFGRLFAEWFAVGHFRMLA
jgi:hypothetical protein